MKFAKVGMFAFICNKAVIVILALSFDYLRSRVQNTQEIVSYYKLIIYWMLNDSFMM